MHFNLVLDWLLKRYLMETLIICRNMKTKLYKPYKKRVCFREKGNKDYTSRFLTRTYKQAKSVKEMYLGYPYIFTK